MSTRKSGRATKAVKYTSASEGSDFEDKKKRTRKTATSTTKKPIKAAATPKSAVPKKASKRAAESDDENASTNDNDATAPTTAPPKPKRQKKDAATLALEAQEKQAKADKAVHKQHWQDWLASHSTEGEMLEEEPDKEESITQTDALKKYGLKKEELTSLLRFEKKNPLYGGVMKLFLEEDVRELGFRKMGMLEGVEGGDEDVVKRGEEIWMEQHKDDTESVDEEKPAETETQDEPAPPKEKKEKEPVKPAKAAKVPKTEKPAKEKTPKQKWAAYISAHAVADHETLTEEPAEAVNQTDSKTKYNLTPKDLACLPFFPKKNPAYGNTIKLFQNSEVEMLAFKKAAILAGVADDGEDEEVLLKKGKEIFEEQQKDEDEDEEEE